MSGLCIVFGGLQLDAGLPGAEGGGGSPYPPCTIGAFYFVPACQARNIYFLGM